MANQPNWADFKAILRRATKPPVGEVRFWAIQLMVIIIAITHLLVDAELRDGTSTFSAGIPVALLMIPVSYAALRYGLSGSAATALWATFGWLPDLLLPHGEGHVGNDVVTLALVDLVALFVGQHIEGERLARDRIEQLSVARLAAEVRFRQLFEANSFPILVLNKAGEITAANPAAEKTLGVELLGRTWREVLGIEDAVEDPSGDVLSLADGQDYRINLVSLDSEGNDSVIQIVLENVTLERTEGRRIRRYAELVVRTEEEQRKRLSRELHDEPLQLFLHLARRLEFLSDNQGLPIDTVESLHEARQQALEAATRLRNLAADLRPPALDQLGLVPAISSLLADLEDHSPLVTSLSVLGEPLRLASDVELGAFRIIQESASNTLRHANAAKMEVLLSFLGNELAIEVSDDGVGFNFADVNALDGTHFGVLGMQERASLLGGAMEISAAPGAGTTVRATLPFQQEPDRASKRVALG